VTEKRDLLYWDTLSEIVNDDLGLWEVLWRARSMFPEASSDNIVDIARRAIQQLLASDIVILVDRDSGNVLDDAATEAALQGPGWQSSPPDTRIWLQPTRNAADEYRSMPKDIAAEIARR
jgi:hypothetical protein